MEQGSGGFRDLPQISQPANSRVRTAPPPPRASTLSTIPHGTVRAGENSLEESSGLERRLAAGSRQEMLVDKASGTTVIITVTVTKNAPGTVVPEQRHQRHLGTRHQRRFSGSSPDSRSQTGWGGAQKSVRMSPLGDSGVGPRVRTSPAAEGVRKDR